MKYYQLYLKTAEVSDNDYISALKELAEIDNDFNGENNVDENQPSAMEQVIDYIENEMTGKTSYEKIARFFEMWLADSDYYTQYDYNIIGERDDIKAIALAYTTE